MAVQHVRTEQAGPPSSSKSIPAAWSFIPRMVPVRITDRDFGGKLLNPTPCVTHAISSSCGTASCLELQRASPAALGQQGAATAFFRQALAFTQSDRQVVVPDRIPIIDQQVAELAGNTTGRATPPIRLDAHVIEGGRAALHTQVQRHRVEAAVLRGRVPDQPLAARFGLLTGDFQQRRQLGLGQPRPDRRNRVRNGSAH